MNQNKKLIQGTLDFTVFKNIKENNCTKECCLLCNTRALYLQVITNKNYYNIIIQWFKTLGTLDMLSNPFNHLFVCDCN